MNRTKEAISHAIPRVIVSSQRRTSHTAGQGAASRRLPQLAIRNCLYRAFGLKPENTAMGIRCADHATPLSAKVGTNFADKRRSLGRYSLLAD
jgi:hypothetical protein